MMKESECPIEGIKTILSRREGTLSLFPCYEEIDMKSPAFARQRASPSISDLSWAQIGDAVASTGPPAIAQQENNAAAIGPGI